MHGFSHTAGQHSMCGNYWNNHESIPKVNYPNYKRSLITWSCMCKKIIFSLYQSSATLILIGHVCLYMWCNTRYYHKVIISYCNCVCVTVIDGFWVLILTDNDFYFLVMNLNINKLVVKTMVAIATTNWNTQKQITKTQL